MNENREKLLKSLRIRAKRYIRQLYGGDIAGDKHCEAIESMETFLYTKMGININLDEEDVGPDETDRMLGLSSNAFWAANKAGQKAFAKVFAEEYLKHVERKRKSFIPRIKK